MVGAAVDVEHDRQGLFDEVEEAAHGKVDPTRAAMVADDYAPQAILDGERDREAGARAVLAEVVDFFGRDGAQDAKCQIERLSSSRDRLI